MGLIEKLENIFSKEEEEKLEITLDEAEETFRSRRSKQLENARKKSDELVSKTDRALEELDESLEELTEYEDAADIQAVEDVAENFYKSRKKLINNFEASDEIEEHFEDLDDFVEELNDVSRKEGAVMKRVEQSSGVLSEKFSDVVEHRDEMSDFLENEYQVVKQLEQIQEAVSRTEEFSEDIKEKEEKIESLNEKITVIKENLDDRKDELDDLESTEAWDRKEDLEDSINYLESRSEDVEKSISRRASNLDRGLKKLIYSVENSGTEFEGDLGVLKRIRDKEFDSLDDPVQDLDKACEKVREEKLLGDRQMKKFEDAVEKFESFESDKNEIREYEDEIEAKKDELEGLEVTDDREKVVKDIEELERKLDERQERLHELEEDLEALEDDRLEELRTLEVFMEKTMGADVSLNAWFEKSKEA